MKEQNTPTKQIIKQEINSSISLVITKFVKHSIFKVLSLAG